MAATGAIAVTTTIIPDTGADTIIGTTTRTDPSGARPALQAPVSSGRLSSIVPNRQQPCNPIATVAEPTCKPGNSPNLTPVPPAPRLRCWQNLIASLQGIAGGEIWMTRRIVRLCFAGAAISLAEPSAALAVEGGAGFYLLGSKGSLAGVVPPPGIYLQSDDYFYSGDAGISGNGSAQAFPIGGIIAAGVEADAYYKIGTALWVLPDTVLGGNLGLSASVVGGWKDVSASLIIEPLGGIALQDDNTAFGDPVLAAMLGWHRGNWHWNVGTMINVPIGQWEEGRLANLGFNRWAVDLNSAVTWLDPASGFEISGVNPRVGRCSPRRPRRATGGGHPRRRRKARWGRSRRRSSATGSSSPGSRAPPPARLARVPHLARAACRPRRPAQDLCGPRFRCCTRSGPRTRFDKVVVANGADIASASSGAAWHGTIATPACFPTGRRSVAPTSTMSTPAPSTTSSRGSVA